MSSYAWETASFSLGQRAETAGVSRDLAHVIYSVLTSRLFFPFHPIASISPDPFVSCPLATSTSDLLDMRCASVRMSSIMLTN